MTRKFSGKTQQLISGNSGAKKGERGEASPPLAKNVFWGVFESKNTNPSDLRSSEIKETETWQ
jgi:hypothetical protein